MRECKRQPVSCAPPPESSVFKKNTQEHSILMLVTTRERISINHSCGSDVGECVCVCVCVSVCVSLCVRAQTLCSMAFF